MDSQVEASRTTVTWGEQLEIAIEAAIAGGHAAMAHYGTAAAHSKADDSPVTAADFASDRAIAEVLELTGWPVLSEESADDSERSRASALWIVDPLDGTREFLAQNGEFSVMIGLVAEGRPVVGAVYLPALDRLYAASSGHGAWVRDAGQAPRRLQCAPADPARLRLVGSRSHPDPLVVELQQALGIQDVQPSGSVGIKCAKIAEGARDLYVHPVPYLKEWDTCAPQIILQEAGGVVSDCTGAELRYNKRDPSQPHGILAASADCAAHVADTVIEVYRRRAGVADA